MMATNQRGLLALAVAILMRMPVSDGIPSMSARPSMLRSEMKI